MKAAVLKDYEQLVTIEDVELHAPKKGEVLVKMKAAGICHSDLHVVNADLPLLVPMILGMKEPASLKRSAKGLHG